MVRQYLMEVPRRRDERAKQVGRVDQPVCDEMTNLTLPLPDTIHCKQ